jgi:O-antigen/teichoic acid export membrane protein
MGEARFIMWTTLGMALTNVGLNSALIPPLGMEGAAIASIAAISCGNVVRCWKLYSLSKAQPLSKNLIKPTLVSLGLIFLFQLVFKNFVTIVWWMLPLVFILYYVIYGVAILFTKSFDKEDISMLLAVEQRAGLNLAYVKRILRRFL